MKLSMVSFALFAVVISLAWQQSAEAQVVVSESVLGNGGGAIGNSNYQIAGTVGQTMAGSHAGFWSTMIDNTPPPPPIPSSSHEEGVWSNSNDPSFTWTIPFDESGIAGYSYEFDNSSTTIPDTVLEETGTSKSYSNRANGTWYFHVRAKDGADIWGATGHYGPVKIDDVDPPPPVISSSTHAENVWSNSDDPSFTWTIPTDESGIAGYSYELNSSSNATLDTVSEGTGTSTSYSNKANGTWYFHARAKDGAGNWGSADDYGPVKIDTQAPSTTITLYLEYPDGENGWYISSVQVTLSATDVLSGVATTKYSLDGGGWRNYTSAFTLSDCEHIIEYYSVDNAGNQEDTKSKEINVDTEPPETGIALSGTEGDNGWYETQVQVTLTPSDICSRMAYTKYRIDSGSWRSYTSPFTLSDCEHTIEYYSMDNAGNREATKTQNVKIDTTAPSASLTLNGTAGENDWYKSDVIVDVVSSDSCAGVGLERIKIGSGLEQTPPVTLIMVGVYTVAYYSVDTAGNESSGVSNRDDASVKIDKTPPPPPQISSSTHGQNTWSNDSSVEVCWTEPSDISGVIGYSYVFDNNPTTIPDENIQITENCMITGTDDGVWYFHVRAKDNAGWWGDTGHYGPIKIDTQKSITTRSPAPEVPDGNNGWYVSSVRVSLSATDSLSGVASIKYRMESGNWQDYTSPFTLSDCEHTIEYYSLDNAENQEDARSEGVKIDTVKPETDIAVSGTVGDKGWYTTSALVTLSPSDDCSGVASTLYRVDNGNWQNYNSPFTLSDCERAVEYYSVDSAGNTEDIKNQGIKVDTIAPLASLTLTGADGENSWYVSDVIVDASSSDNCSGIISEYVRIDGGMDQTPPIILETEGIHTVTYYARDHAGNESSDASNRDDASVKIDKTPPPAPAISSAIHISGACSNSNSPEFSWTEPTDTSGIAGYSYEFDKNPLTVPDEVVDGVDAFTSYSNQDDADDWYFHVRAKDNAGHWGETGHFGPVMIDTQKPATTVTYHPGTPDGMNGWYVGPVQITLSAEDSLCGVAATKYRIDNGIWQEYSSPFILSDCEHTIEYYSMDIAGNQESITSEAVKIDTARPETAIDLSGTEGDKGWYTTPVQITLLPIDDCSGVVSTQYRVDDGGWQEYSSPFTLPDCERGVEYYSVDSAGNTEVAKTRNLKIDTVAPGATLVLNDVDGENNWYVSDVIVDVNSSDICSGILWEYVKVDSGLEQTPPIILGAEGIHAITYYARDHAGNESNDASNRDSASVKIDKTPPPAPAISSAIHISGACSNSNSPEFSWTEPTDTSGIAGYSYEFDKNPLTVPDEVVDGVDAFTSYSNQDDADDWYFHVRAKDNAGHWGETGHFGPVMIDTQKPATTVTYHPGTPDGMNGWYVGPVQITLSAEDSLCGVAATKYRIDNGAWQEYSLPFTLSDCEHTVEYYSMDMAGNQEDTRSEAVKIDTAKPETGIVLSATGSGDEWNRDPVQVTLSAVDSCSGVAYTKYRIDSGNWQDYSTPFVLSDCEHGVEYYSVDNAGNIEDTETWNLKIDTEPSLTTVNISGTAADNGWYVTPVEVSLSALDICSGVAYTKYRIDSGNWQDYSAPFILSDCEHIVEYYSEDEAGNVEDIKSHEIKVDTITPDVNLVLVGIEGENNWYISDVTADVESADDCSGIGAESVIIDGDSEQTPPYKMEMDGIHTVGYYALDNAGNESSSEEVREETTVKIDKTPPPAPAISSAIHTPGVWSNNNSPAFSWTEPTDTSGISGYSYEFDKNPLTIPDKVVDGVGAFTSYSDSGDADDWYFHVRAKDNAGHWGEAGHFGPVKIDTQAPTASISIFGDSGENEWYISDVVLDCDTTDPAPSSGIRECLIQVDGEPWQPAPVSVTGRGIHTIAFYAVDNAGNEGEKQYNEIKLDKIPPEFGPNTDWYYSPYPLTQDTVRDLVVTVTIRDATSGLSDSPPQLDYRITGGHKDYDGYKPMTKAAGKDWFFTIDENWDNFGGERIICKIEAYDKAGNYREEEYPPIPIGVPMISVSPNPINFGALQVGKTSSVQLIISNIGQARLRVEDITLDVPEYILGDILLSGPPIPFDVAPGEEDRGYTLVLKPSSVYKFQGSVTVRSNEQNPPEIPTGQIDMSGIFPAPEIYGIEPDVVNPGGGTRVIITGANFVDDTIVNIDGKIVDADVTSATHITVIMPPGPSGVKVTIQVINPDSQQAVLTDGLTYCDNSTITMNTSPKQVPWNSEVLVSGNVSDQRNASVKFGNVAVLLVFTPPEGKDIKDSVRTDSNGEYEYIKSDFVPEDIGEWLVMASWAGDSIYCEAEFDGEFEVVKVTPVITWDSIDEQIDEPLLKIIDERTISMSGIVDPNPGEITLKVVITDPDGIKHSPEDPVVLEENGVFSFDYTIDKEGLWEFDASWEGDDWYNESIENEENENNDLQVMKFIGKAIIVEGVANNEAERELLNSVSYDSYEALLKRHFTHEDIYYITSAKKGKYADEVTSLATWEYGITQWVTDELDQKLSKFGKAVSLYVIVVGHGGNKGVLLDRQIVVDGGNTVVKEDFLTGENLNDWLDPLVDKCSDITVVIEACQSGTFIKKELLRKDEERIIITSSQANSDATIRKHYSFTNFFFRKIAEVWSVEDAFKWAYEKVTNDAGVFGDQEPQLEANGDMPHNNLGDYQKAREKYIDGNYPSMKLAAPPVILDASDLIEITDGEGKVDIWAMVSWGEDPSDEEMERVWVEILPPDYRDSLAEAEYAIPDISDSGGVLEPEGGGGRYSRQCVGLDQAGTYTALIFAENQHGISEPWVVKIEIPAAVDPEDKLAALWGNIRGTYQFTLEQNYPNPFNPDTWIPYQLARDVEPVISIYDSTGRLIRRLDLGHRPAGRYVDKDKAAYWDGKNRWGEEVASGVYFYHFQAGSFTAVRKLIIIE